MLNKFTFSAFAVTTIALTLAACQSTPEKNKHSTMAPVMSAKAQSYLDFPTPLSAKTPHDVDLQLKKKLDDEKKFVEVQRLFEIVSWQNFVALNWPKNANGQAQASIAAKGSYPWQDWKESFEVFQANGAEPLPWGQHSLPDNFKMANGGDIPIMYRTSRVDLRNGANVEDEFDQAFTGPIWDQNGNMVRYQVMMNQSEFDYIVANELYNLDGQLEFYNQHKSVTFPSATRTKDGATEIKLAWKEITESDISERYLTVDAYVTDEKGEYSIKKMGMVGMHIAIKTESSPQWIWATFEHVDNVQANELEQVNGKTVKASFNNPNCDICPINVYPQQAGDYADTTHKVNQIQRVVPISKETQALNSQVQTLLADNRSVLQYYELIGTQWPTDPSSPAYDVSVHNANNPPALPYAVTNKSGGKPTPVWLTNMVMETYFQGETAGGTDVAAYNTKIANEEAWTQIQGFKTYGTNTDRIFGTESCIGCHYSGSIVTSITTDADGKKTAHFEQPASSDFSWLLQMKAQFKTAE